MATLAPNAASNAKAADPASFIENLAASVRATDAVPSATPTDSIMTGATQPATLEEALAIIEQQKAIIGELQAQVSQTPS